MYPMTAIESVLLYIYWHILIMANKYALVMELYMCSVYMVIFFDNIILYMNTKKNIYTQLSHYIHIIHIVNTM